MWDAEPSALGTLGKTHLGSTDRTASQQLFGDVLGGSETRDGDSLTFAWPSGAIQVNVGETAGIQGMSLSGTGLDELFIGSVRLGDFD